MCGNCGCPTHTQHEHGPHTHVHEPMPENLEGSISISVLENILEDNDARARANRVRFSAIGVLAVNLMSSPGSGKTRWLEATAAALGAGSMAVIEGDLETDNDARRLRAKGVAAHQITTGRACHLNADLVARGVAHLPAARRPYLFIENVGNLVCPADFDLGQHANVVLLAVTEGDDKPEKYPPIFRAADLVLLTKIDLLPLLDDFDIERARAAIARIQPAARVIPCSAKDGRGMDEWLAWLTERQQSRHHAD